MFNIQFTIQTNRLGELYHIFDEIPSVWLRVGFGKFHIQRICAVKLLLIQQMKCSSVEGFCLCM